MGLIIALINWIRLPFMIIGLIIMWIKEYKENKRENEK